MSTIKRGDTLALSGNAGVTFNGATVTDYTGWSVASQLRTAVGVLVADLTATLSALGVVTISASAATTALWSPGSYEVDIQFTTPTGEIISTATAKLAVLADVTR